MDLSRDAGENAIRLELCSTHAPRRFSADAALHLLCQHPGSLINRPGFAQSLRPFCQLSDHTILLSHLISAYCGIQLEGRPRDLEEWTHHGATSGSCILRRRIRIF
jgi:hypothetical protein